MTRELAGSSGGFHARCTEDAVPNCRGIGFTKRKFTSLTPQPSGAVSLEKVDLDRYELTGRLGVGADYEVRAATDRQTGREVAALTSPSAPDITPPQRPACRPWSNTSLPV